MSAKLDSLKLLTVLLLSVCFATSSFSQNKHSVWEITERNEGVGEPIDKYAYVTGEDTLIDGKTFQAIWLYQYEREGEYYEYGNRPYPISDTSFVGYLYREHLKMEAIITGPVPEAAPNDLCKDSLITIYDFTLQVGDTIAYPCSAHQRDSVTNVIPADSSSTGKRTIELLSPYQQPFKIMDSIGSEYGLFRLCCPPHCQPPPCGYELTTYCEDINKNCALSGKITGIGSNSIHAGQVEIYPNPANHTLHIQQEGISESYDIRIWDVMGTLKMHENNHHNRHVQMDIAGLSDGVYVVEVMQDNKIITREKIIKK